MEDNVLDKMVKSVLLRCNNMEQNISKIRRSVDEFLREIRELERRVENGDEKA